MIVPSPSLWAREDCKHLWTMFCQGDYGPHPVYRVGWRIDICVLCYTKRQVAP